MTNSEIDVTDLKDIGSFEGSLAQRVYLALQEAILSLQFLPGAVVRKGPVCEKLGVSRPNVTSMERGRRPIGTGMADRLSRVFGVPRERFLR